MPQKESSCVKALHFCPIVILLLMAAASGTAVVDEKPQTGSENCLYRADGVKITHNPYTPSMVEKYGLPGKTDGEGFDPYADSVGAGIYSGRIKRDPSGNPMIGKQYQDHNPRPGPVYAGGGFTPVSRAIAAFSAELEAVEADDTSLGKLLSQYPDLVNDVSTGGATPLHTCGMSRRNQMAAAYIILRGGDVDALDTYGYTPLHRMASNNLDEGARALLASGADPLGLTGCRTVGTTSETPFNVARGSHAFAAAKVIETFGTKRSTNSDGIVGRVAVLSAGYEPVVGSYSLRPAHELPPSFASVCTQNGWDPASTWARLNGGFKGAWYAHENGSYIYFNGGDGLWWIDGPDGLGVYTAPGSRFSPPCASTSWSCLDKGGSRYQLPTLGVFRNKSL